jgi:hypothetical protein
MTSYSRTEIYDLVIPHVEPRNVLSALFSNSLDLLSAFGLAPLLHLVDSNRTMNYVSNVVLLTYQSNRTQKHPN